MPVPFGRDPFSRAPRTPGPLGHNDAGDPNNPVLVKGETPGPLGVNDYADPTPPALSVVRPPPGEKEAAHGEIASIKGPIKASSDAPKTEKKDIPLSDGQLIVKEAATWKGTPYALIGEDSKKGTGADCSGSTQKIYNVAGFAYDYKTTEEFPNYAKSSGLFRELDSDEAKQDGDILWWQGHVAIYSSFATDKDNATTQRTNKQGKKWTQDNDMWTASHTKGPPYAPAEMRYFKPGLLPKVYRYQK